MDVDQPSPRLLMPPPPPPPATAANKAASVAARKERSKVWDYFKKIESASGVRIGKCIRCGQEFKADPKKNGTSEMKDLLIGEHTHEV
ncbi:hypothetical protein Tsubulata_015418 [Turnera subulata]|uniref:BED-type domain-containing protein n=1 Tax=Turnera subulata TaxID=218843 RepID=A0A9Q0FT59_9ROSI|nr:hypothetical protein Tsubulata_008478 [Turnera subulata]KAJ4840256.1 hypothetical protein Tsubulata_015418 [Turnera subulata]